jgi:glutamine synthetase
MILPVCYAYHGALAASASAAKSAGVAVPQTETLQRISQLISSLQSKRSALESAVHRTEQLTSEEEKAKVFSREVSAAMADVRTLCDDLEAIVADDYWPLPKYREMLFLSS